MAVGVVNMVGVGGGAFSLQLTVRGRGPQDRVRKNTGRAPLVPCSLRVGVFVNMAGTSKLSCHYTRRAGGFRFNAG